MTRLPVITGLGVVSPFGLGADAFFQGLAEGRSAIGPIRSFDAATFPICVAGEVPSDRRDKAPPTPDAAGGSNPDAARG